jgi:hypothetical protein
MKLGKKDKAFRTNKVSYLDYKIVEMDRVLTSSVRSAKAQWSFQ